jgi:lathosterol oxidase
MTLKYFLTQLLDVSDKYFLVEGIAFLLIYVVLRRRIAWRKIQLKFPADKDYRREIIDSTISMLVFALPPVIIQGVPAIRVHTQLYRGFLVVGPMDGDVEGGL